MTLGNALLPLLCCLLAVGALAWEPVSLRRRALVTETDTSQTAVIPSTTTRSLKSADGADYTSKRTLSTPPGQLRKTDSYSKKKLKGIFHIIVIGNGKTCFVKVNQKGISKSEQFGDTTSTQGFIAVFGRAECEPGDKGVSHGFVKASLIAEAYQLGDECEASVLATVSNKTKDVKRDDGVEAIVESAVGGVASAYC